MGVANRLESLQRNFLWRITEDKRMNHLVAREEVKKPLKSGGLGLRSLVKANKAP